MTLINIYQVYHDNNTTPRLTKVHRRMVAISGSLISLIVMRNIIIDIASMILFIGIIQTNRCILNTYYSIQSYYKKDAEKHFQLIDWIHFGLILL